MAKPRLRLITKKQLHALEDALYNIHRAVIRATYETDDPTIVIDYHEEAALEHARAAADYIKLYISRDRFAMRYGLCQSAFNNDPLPACKIDPPRRIKS